MLKGGKTSREEVSVTLGKTNTRCLTGHVCLICGTVSNDSTSLFAKQACFQYSGPIPFICLVYLTKALKEI